RVGLNVGGRAVRRTCREYVLEDARVGTRPYGVGGGCAGISVQLVGAGRGGRVAALRFRPASLLPRRAGHPSTCSLTFIVEPHRRGRGRCSVLTPSWRCGRSAGSGR